MMFINQSSLLYSVPFKFSSLKNCEKTKFYLPEIGKRQETKAHLVLFSSSSSSENNNNLSSCLRRKSQEIKMCMFHDGYTLQHPLETSELRRPFQSGVDDNINGGAGGIGILEFFQGKNIFITGATGLVGKALLEKLLRSESVGKIYLLIKAKDEDAAFLRLTNEIINSKLFKSLKVKHGKYYEEFVRSKLIAIAGNICEENLGMESWAIDAIKNEVDIIIESAAITTLNERYDLIFDSNVSAPQRLMNLAKSCKSLELFTHISTAYVNGGKGILYESVGEYGRTSTRNTSNVFVAQRPDGAHEIQHIMASSSSTSPHNVNKELKRLGQERAELYGWNNVYQMTKAMGEMTLNDMRGDIPLLIIRPSVIESTYKDPFPGWIQGNRMFDPIIIAYAKGQLPAFMGDPKSHMDIVPLDMVVSTTIAAIAKHGLIAENKPQVNVYHVASSIVNPLTWSDFFEFMYESFNSKPLIQRFDGINNISDNNETTTLAKIKYFDNFNDLSKYTRDVLFRPMNHESASAHVGDDDYQNQNEKLMMRIDQKIKNQCKAKVACAEQLNKLYGFVGSFNARFHTGNTQKLLREMSKEEKLMFEVDVTTIDWRKYFLEIHIPGLRKHVLTSSGSGRTDH